MATRNWLAAILAATMVPTQISCSDLVCGEGTMERDGECVPAEGASPDIDRCADGTHYDANENGCVPDLPPTVCEEGTTVEDVDPETGYVVCVGIGGSACSLPCPTPGTGKISLCGQLYDAQTDAKIDESNGETMVEECDLDNPTATGPCSLEVAFYPALPFATNPTGTPPLAMDNFRMNNCGRFAAEGIEEPELGYAGIGVDDHPDATGDNYTLAGVALPAAAGLKRSDLIVYGVRRSTDMAWTTSAGDPFSGTTFGTRGVYVPIFLHGDDPPDAASAGVPVAGVVVTENGTVETANTYYFTDLDPHTRATPDVAAGAAGGSLDATGANGSALKVNSSLVNHSGTGMEPAGCEWPSDLAASIMGVTFVQRRVAETTAGDPCP